MARTIDRTVEATTTPPRGVAPIRKVKRGGPAIVQFYRSAVGKKWVMAVTGIVLMGFVLVPHDREPQALPLEGGAEPLRRGPPRRPRPPAPPHGAAVDGPDRAHRRVRVPHPRRRHAHDHEPQGASGRRTSRSATTSPPTSRRARCAGPASSSLLFLIFHLMDLTWGNANPDFVRGDPYNNLDLQHATRTGGDHLHRRQHRARRSTCTTAPGRCSRASGSTTRSTTRRVAASRRASPAVILVGNLTFPIAVQLDLVERRVPDTTGSGRPRTATEESGR